MTQTGRFAVIVVLAWAISGCAVRPGAGTSPAPRAVQVLSDDTGRLEALEMVVPFYEGLLLRNPVAAAHETGFTDLELAYPGALSAPFVAWRFPGEEWNALYASSTTAVPVALHLRAENKRVTLDLRSYAPCTFKQLRVAGNWIDLARGLRAQWGIKARSRPLSKDFSAVHSYVHQWVSETGDPALRVNWTLDKLLEQMRREQPTTLQYVYGFDPGGVDIGGEYFWSKDAPAKVQAVLGANPRLSHLSWLNLRTYKWAIPTLGIQVPLTPAVLAGAKKQPPGVAAPEGQYSYKSVEMCLASAEWQESRLRQFDRLAEAGFKVIELDEFPVPTCWQIAPCQAANHLHRPADAASEWQHIMAFLEAISRRARDRGVRLICEEPSAALLPHVCGYIDRQYNKSSAFYAPWRKSHLVETIPLFSTMFGDLVSPYTDLDPDTKPPAGWLINLKMWPR